MRKKNRIRFLLLCGALWMSAGSVWAADLKLNPDTLMKARDNGGVDARADELFIGVGDESFTFADMENCLKRYGLDYHRWDDKDSDGFFMYGLYFGAHPDETFMEKENRLWDNYDGSWTEEDPQWVQIMNQRESILYQTPLNKNTEFTVYLSYGYDGATDEFITYPASVTDELIERIAIINHGDYTLKNGWVWEDNAWRYYENDAMVTGFKWIDGQLYCFEDNGFMIHDCFREIAGNKYHFNENWADRGWQTLTENGETSWYYFSMEDAHAMKGYVNGIEGDGFKYFFWQEGFTDQNGKAYPAGALAQGTDGADLWVCQNGNPLYVADKDGRLYVNVEKELNGIRYNTDGNGNVASVKILFETKIDEIATIFPVGKYWQHIPGQESQSNPYIYLDNPYSHVSHDYNNPGVCGCNAFDGAIQCRGFGRLLFYNVFGEKAMDNQRRMTTQTGEPISAYDVRKGDYVDTNNHGMFITDVYVEGGTTHWKVKRAVWGNSNSEIAEEEYTVQNEKVVDGTSGTLMLTAVRRASDDARKRVGLP